jgi:hypothetical protein
MNSGWAAGLLLGILTGCTEDVKFDTDVKNAKEPTVSVTAGTGKTASTITLSAEILSPNGYPVTERGFCWGTGENEFPTVGTDNFMSVTLDEQKQFVATIENLEGNTKYHLRAYAVNRTGTGYGEPVAVTTNDGLGETRTFEPYNIHATTATCGGVILFPGEGRIMERGVNVSTTLNMQNLIGTPFLSSQETDSFACNVTGLKAFSTYYVQAYVKNTFGYFYGAVKSFTTSDGRPRMDTVQIWNPGFSEVSLVSGILDAGDAPYLSRGFFYSDSPMPDDSTSIIRLPSVTYNGGGDLQFVGMLTDLKPQTRYYVRSFARNIFGWAFSPAAEFWTKSETPTVETLLPAFTPEGTVILTGKIIANGKSDVYFSGMCFSSTEIEPSITNGSYDEILPDAGGDLRMTLSGWRGSTTYYIRAFAANSEGVSYGETKVLEVPRIFSSPLAQFPGEERLQGSPAYFSSGSKGFIAGGDLGPTYTSELWSFDALTGSWFKLRSYESDIKWQSAVAYSSSAIFFLGGIGSDYRPRNDFVRYSDGNMWYSIVPRTPGPDSAYLRAGFLLDDDVCFVGGMNDAALKEVWAYNVPANTWSQKNDFPEEQYGGIAVTVGDTVYAGLGKNTAGVCNKALWRSSDLTAWTPEPVGTLISGGIVAGVAYNNKIYVIDEAAWIFEYTPRAQTWQRKSRLPAGMQHIHCMYVLENMIYIGLGSSRTLIIYSPQWDN